MGKGGGCVTSKHPKPPPPTTTTTPPPPPQTQPTTTPTPPQPTPPPKTPKIFIVFYSMYGHVEALAKKMKAAIDSVQGVEATLYRVPETLSDDVLSKMRAPSKDDNIPVMESVADLAEADGFLFGFPTRFGTMAAQMKAFFDATGKLWKEQKLSGKPAGFFVSTGTQGGGQETTA
ncbi:oxidoreductase [Lithospermum erythrorhizon]|uniref:NAD(P)H dehydrogenase (quinone) n=1 Tax=Lithospermum erythrorhizon TaxID=34254 RepID=A0AAV3NW22_LITER